MVKLLVSAALVETVGPMVVVDLPGVGHLELDTLLVDSTILEVVVDILVLVAIFRYFLLSASHSVTFIY